jgi:ribosomal protein L37AE/L43A
MSVTELTRKFEELSHYSTHNEYAGNEMWKVNQFKHAMRGEIYAVVSQQRLTNFDEMVHNSLEAERGFDKAVREGSTTFDRKRGNFVDRHHEKLKTKGSPQKVKQTGSLKPFPTCKKCGRAHAGECKIGIDSCYACGQKGHYMANCPNRGSKDKGVNTTMSKGRVYSLDGKKAQANEDLIGGMCFLGQNSIRVLFDCGATCTFISFQCVEALQLTVSLLNPLCW